MNPNEIKKAGLSQAPADSELWSQLCASDTSLSNLNEEALLEDALQHGKAVDKLEELVKEGQGADWPLEAIEVYVDDIREQASEIALLIEKNEIEKALDKTKYVLRWAGTDDLEYDSEFLKHDLLFGLVCELELRMDEKKDVVKRSLLLEDFGVFLSGLVYDHYLTREDRQDYFDMLRRYFEYLKRGN